MKIELHAFEGFFMPEKWGLEEGGKSMKKKKLTVASQQNSNTNLADQTCYKLIMFTAFVSTSVAATRSCKQEIQFSCLQGFSTD